MIHRGGVNWLNTRIYLTVLVERRQNKGHLPWKYLMVVLVEWVRNTRNTPGKYLVIMLVEQSLKKRFGLVQIIMP